MRRLLGRLLRDLGLAEEGQHRRTPGRALDAEIARTLLKPRLGKAWFGVFALPYLSLFAVVLVAWHLAPISTLVAFLAASVWHFGKEDTTYGDVLEVLFRGGLPIALPMLVHPAATSFVLTTIAGQANRALGSPGIDGTLPSWLHAASLLWLLATAAWLLRTLARGDLKSCRLPGSLAGLFVVLPPLQAFTLYFVCLHAPLHTGAVIACRHLAPRVYDRRSAWLLAMPVTGLTIVIGIALWPLYDGPVATRLLSLTLQMLAALTLPHMLLDAITSAHVQSAATKAGYCRTAQCPGHSQVRSATPRFNELRMKALVVGSAARPQQSGKPALCSACLCQYQQQEHPTHL